MLDEGGRQIDFCKYGDNIQITFDVKFNNVVENPIFGLRITDHRNSVVYGTNNKLHGVKTDIYKPGDKIRVIFKEKINLIGGDYFVSPSVGNKDTKTYCDWIIDMMTINVIHKNIAEGIADLDSEVSIERIQQSLEEMHQFAKEEGLDKVSEEDTVKVVGVARMGSKR